MAPEGPFWAPWVALGVPFGVPGGSQEASKKGSFFGGSKKVKKEGSQIAFGGGGGGPDPKTFHFLSFFGGPKSDISMTVGYLRKNIKKSETIFRLPFAVCDDKSIFR